jgi:hypothetical protein
MRIKAHTEYVILATKGRFYEGELDGTICFVPNETVQSGQLKEGLLSAKGGHRSTSKLSKPGMVLAVICSRT